MIEECIDSYPAGMLEWVRKVQVMHRSEKL